MDRQRPLAQHCEHYTAEDFRVWKLLFERQHGLLESRAASRYLNALQHIGFNAGEIPDFRRVNEQLMAATGWELSVVRGHVPPAAFFTQLAARRFPATCWLRRFDEIDYIEEPDMFHDVFGHVPLLLDAEYADFLQAFGAAALELVDDEGAITGLSRLYWFTIEFGLIQDAGGRKIYGAGILSSPGETHHSMSAVPECADFDLERVLRTAFRTDVMQDLYFSIPSFRMLRPVLNAAIEKLRRNVLAD